MLGYVGKAHAQKMLGLWGTNWENHEKKINFLLGKDYFLSWKTVVFQWETSGSSYLSYWNIITFVIVVGEFNNHNFNWKTTSNQITIKAWGFNQQK